LRFALETVMAVVGSGLAKPTAGLFLFFANLLIRFAIPWSAASPTMTEGTRRTPASAVP